MNGRWRYGQVTRALVGVCLCSSAALSAEDGGAVTTPAPRAAAEATAQGGSPPSKQVSSSHAKDRGAIVYQRNCSWCHGVAGDGMGPSAHRFANPATNFTAGVFKCRSTPAGSLPTDGDLRRSINAGLDATGMPSFIALGPMQIDELVETVKLFSPRFEKETPKPAPLPPEPPDSPASVAHGKEVYASMKCATCHGERGEGGPGALKLRNPDGTEAHVTDFTRWHGLKCGDEPAQIYDSIANGLDGTAMAPYAGAMSPEDGWNLVHYIIRLRR